MMMKKKKNKNKKTKMPSKKTNCAKRNKLLAKTTDTNSEAGWGRVGGGREARKGVGGRGGAAKGQGHNKRRGKKTGRPGVSRLHQNQTPNRTNQQVTSKTPDERQLAQQQTPQLVATTDELKPRSQRLPASRFPGQYLLHRLAGNSSEVSPHCLLSSEPQL